MNDSVIFDNYQITYVYLTEIQAINKYAIPYLKYWFSMV